MNRISLFVFVMLLLASCGEPTRKTETAEKEPTPPIDYERALQNLSTAPNFIAYTVIDGNTGKRQQVCTEAPFLLGAIHKEYDIPYDDEGCDKALKIALENRDRVFHFNNTEAIANVTNEGWEKILEEVKVELEGLSKEELEFQLADDESSLHSIYHREEKPFVYMDAVAFVLLKNGIRFRRGCEVFNLFPASDFNEGSHEKN